MNPRASSEFRPRGQSLIDSQWKKIQECVCVVVVGGGGGGGGEGGPGNRTLHG